MGGFLLASDSLLIQRALRGDPDAFAELVGKYHKQVFNLAYRLTGNREDAMDVTQETMLRAFRALPSFREGADFLPWVYRIAWNICADRGRKQKRTPAMSSLEGNEAEARTLPNPGPSPDEDVEREELRRTLESAISRLDDGYRELVVMFHVDGLSIKEISEITGLKDTVIKNRLYRGRRMLREILRESGFAY
ncbi:MAG TPA: sigma-70 family RNA polymerase sigma factor [Firmicutes bacterium]|nr:sigma-70 family RNA polymerase sigma factor [Candidatus Fermentithermobacillaceae bacterium]